MYNCFLIKSGKLYFRIILAQFFTSGTWKLMQSARKKDQPWKIAVRKRVFDVIMNLNWAIFTPLKIRGDRFPLRFICQAIHLSWIDGAISRHASYPSVIFHKCLLDYPLSCVVWSLRGKNSRFHFGTVAVSHIKWQRIALEKMNFQIWHTSDDYELWKGVFGFLLNVFV